MIRGSSLIWSCILVLTICVRGYTEDSGLQSLMNRDYFTVTQGAGAHSRWLVQDVEANHLDKAMIYLRQGKVREAINDCRYVLDRFVNHPRGLVILAFAAKLAKEPLLPLPYFERAVKFYPARALTHAQYGKYLTEIGKVEEGIKKLRHAMEIDPKLKIAYTWLANVYLQGNNVDRARQVLQRKKEIENLETVGPEIRLDGQVEALGKGGEWGGEIRGEDNTGGESLLKEHIPSDFSFETKIEEDKPFQPYQQEERDNARP